MDSLVSSLLKPISGKYLLEKYSQHSKLVFPDYVSRIPKIALKKIEEKFKFYPSLSGNNISGIVDIRDYIFEISNSKNFSNVFVITAPHTHWNLDKPIIYRYFEDKNEYIIGQHNIKKNVIYYPVSFAFYKDYPLAYEWLESTSDIIQKDFQTIYSAIIKINSKFKNNNYPLGIAIDFRFKKSIFKKAIPTVELVIDDDKNYEFYKFSRIVSREFFNSSPLAKKTILEQVGWNSVSDLFLKLNKEETEILNEVRQFVSAENEKTTLKKIDEIKEKLNFKKQKRLIQQSR